VLFVCNGNVARSQEAEAFFTALASGPHHAMSAGVDVAEGKPLDPMVLAVMRELGYQMTGTVRKVVTAPMVVAADLVVSFKPRSELPDFVSTANDVRHWPVEDPRGKSLDFHRAVRDQISLTEELAAELRTVSGRTPLDE
jgi:protein-tyrosine-phosphatase